MEKWFVDIDPRAVKYEADTSGPGNLLNWMGVLGSTSANKNLVGLRLHSTYYTLAALAVL